ncbi:MAG: hypothetical protein IJ109_09990 [Firmicutes bacterium]|nr:hypothetical protein [Bacillota bacterium]
MTEPEYILGIDTSNYKTSVAVLSRDHIECDIRKFLDVKQGERGLRQSEALFQHVKNLPELFETACNEFSREGNLREDIRGIAFSSKPRPQEGSYMPCFLAGESFARSLGAVLNVPVIGFSHQEGHIQAIKSYTEMASMDEFLACHFSGGTCEVLRIRSRDYDPSNLIRGSHFQWVRGEGAFYDVEIIGGSRDISFGQVLDRAGVAMGFSFPAGAQMDEIALRTRKSTNMLTPIKVTGGEINLSGIDTQIKNKLSSLSMTRSIINVDQQVRDELIREIFVRISDCLTELLKQASRRSGLKDIIMSGGVSSSRFIRSYVSDRLEEEDIIVYFDDNENDLATDNAVGTALLGGKLLWD